MTTRVQRLSDIEYKWYPRGLPLWLLSCTTFLKEGVEELHCRSMSTLQLSRFGATGLTQSVLIDPLSKEQRLNIESGPMFIARNELDKLKGYRTFWYDYLLYIDELLTRLSITSEVRTSRVTAQMYYSFQEEWLPEVNPHINFRCSSSEKLQLDIFELEIRPLIRDVYFPLSERTPCWDEVRDKVIEEFERVNRMLVGKEGTTSVDASLDEEGKGTVLLRYAKT